MIRRVALVGCVAMFVTALVTGQGAMPTALAAMADTERAFAKTATVKGWRDAFLDFFADDAVALGREVGLAKDGLRKLPSTPFSEAELLWEPRLGDVAASADLAGGRGRDFFRQGRPARRRFQKPGAVPHWP